MQPYRYKFFLYLKKGWYHWKWRIYFYTYQKTQECILLFQIILTLLLDILTIQSVIDYSFTNKFVAIQFYIISAVWIVYFNLYYLLIICPIINCPFQIISRYLFLYIFITATSIAIISYFYRLKVHKDSRQEMYP